MWRKVNENFYEQHIFSAGKMLINQCKWQKRPEMAIKIGVSQWRINIAVMCILSEHYVP